MTLDRISSGSRFEELAAYSRAVVDADYVHISGTVGGDPVTGVLPEDVRAQAGNIFRIVEALLSGQGCSLADVVRTRVYIVEQADLLDVAAVLKEKFDDNRPANTTLICGIPAPGAKVEIEFTARRHG
jgi:enamine deaminase RidA (YjgF/YER057c/UK114 family)